VLHLVLYGLLAVLVAVGLFLLASRFLPAGEQIAPPLRDEPPWELPPERSLQAADVDAVRLPVALRGYRFAETDILLDRLANELRSRDEEIDRLRGRAADTAVSLDKPDDGDKKYAPPPPTAPPTSPPTDEPAPPDDDRAPASPRSPTSAASSASPESDVGGS
jgi:hypothetical protein